MALHRSLDGTGPQPLSLYVYRLCSLFHCRPTELDEEQRRLPVGFLEDISEAGAYQSAYDFYKANPDTKDRSELVQLAKRITFELAKEEIKAKQTRR